ncbi:MAG TPA: histidine phosphatase family protein [Solirubrobacteraceae bacterium]|jgi:probable phosphoglycerate mutase|nr:histidine phosphatase family protein [Solirubrobacteraceae bacterium]
MSTPEPGGAPPRAPAVLIRHAQTEWSRDGRHTSRTDVALTDEGRRLARGLAARLRGWEFERVLVSPARRARETCELSGLGERAELCEDLREWDYGEDEGLTTPEILARRPGWELWRDGCPGGESPAAVGLRADRVIAMLDGAGGAAALFSHGHMLRVLGARWIELQPGDGRRLGLSTGAVCVLGAERRTPILARWNDTGERG